MCTVIMVREGLVRNLYNEKPAKVIVSYLFSEIME